MDIQLHCDLHFDEYILNPLFYFYGIFVKCMKVKIDLYKYMEEMINSSKDFENLDRQLEPNHAKHIDLIRYLSTLLVIKLVINFVNK